MGAFLLVNAYICIDMTPITKQIKRRGQSPIEVIRINQGKRRVYTRLTHYVYRDIETRQIIVYIPSIEVSAYGQTREKAFEMLKYSMEQFYEYILNLSLRDLNLELKKFGFTRNKIQTKEFSKAYVDKSGELKQFAVGNEVIVSSAAI